jgi:hypothetical protein
MEGIGVVWRFIAFSGVVDLMRHLDGRYMVLGYDLLSK